MSQKIIDDFKSFKAENKNRFPFLDIEFDVLQDLNEKSLNFGIYNSKRHTSYPFYKPISKIINIHKLDGDK